jgi:cell division septation protein DedD
MAKVRAADSLAAIKRADSLAFAALPLSKQKKILAEKAKAEKAAAAAANPPAPKPAAPAPAKGATAGGAPAAHDSSSTPATPPPPREHGPFAIDAGEYVDQGKANSVADDLKAKTKLAAQVTTLDGGTFHVLLGKFPSRSAAESKANSLMGKGLIEQGGVIPIPKPAETKPADAKPAG